MQFDVTLLVGWLAVPLAIYGMTVVGVRLRARRAPVARPFDAALRLEELRAQRAPGHGATRGRMAEALRLAEGATSPPALQQHRS
ncbi:hypothetical protein [Janibacter sp. GS2]|uniref:hypothetical protein n=1 Tax=Janibacter sp. GS2 TaxID=3442646 RepID=UPI003EB93FFB